MTRRPLLLLISLLAYLILVQSQQVQRMTTHTQGNAANEFYTGFMQNYIKPVFQDKPDLILNKGSLLITTAEPSGVLVLIESQQGNSTHMVKSGDTVIISLPGFKVQNSTDRSKGIRIKTEQSKSVVLHALNEELHSLDGFTALPCTSYPSLSVYTYFAVSVPRSSIVADTSADSAFLIVACSDNTVVDITCTQNIQHPTQSGGEILAGKSFQITLNERETLYIQSRHDLTGSKVESTAPVSFYSGHECGNVPRNESECDHLVEQLPPTATWDRQFLLAPTATRRAYDVIKVIASENDTLVAVSCTNLNNVSDVFNISLVSAGKFSDFTLSFNQYCSVISDKPILVVQFTTGKSVDNAEKGDPFMLMVPAVSQYLENTTFSTISGLGLLINSYMNVFFPAGRNEFDPSSVILNGKPLTVETLVAIPCSDGSICGHAVQVILSGGVHSIWNTNYGFPLGVTVYGISYLESYAYPGALKLSLSDSSTIAPPLQTSYLVLIDGSICLPCNVHPFHYASIIEWQKDGTVLVENGRSEITNNGALCIRNVTQNDEGNYSCHVMETHVSYQLTVIAASALLPVILQSPASATAGEVVELSCSVSVVERLVQSPTLDWSGGSVGQPGVVVTNLTILGSTIWRNISFSPLKTSHGGKYVCQAELSMPTIDLQEAWNSSTDLLVQIPRPAVSVSGAYNSTMLESGSSLQLTCSIQPQGVEHVDTPTTIMSRWSSPSSQYNRDGASTVALNISNVGSTDSGAYTCTASVSDSSGSGYVVASEEEVDTVSISVSVLFQLKLSGVSICSEWVADQIEIKIADIRVKVVEQLSASCHCPQTSIIISKETFACFDDSSTHVTYRAKLSGRQAVSSASLLTILEAWTSTGPAISVKNVLLRVDTQCSVAISSFNEGECSTRQPPTTMATTDDTFQSINTAGIIGGTVAVIIVLILAILIGIIVVIALVLRARRGHATITTPEEHPMKTYHGPESGIATSSNSAYEIVKHQTDSQDYRGSSKRGVHQQVIYDEVISLPLPSAQVGTGGFNVKLVPSHQRIPLPAEPVAIIHGDGKQNGVDEEIVYDVLPGDVDQ